MSRIARHAVIGFMLLLVPGVQADSRPEFSPIRLPQSSSVEPTFNSERTAAAEFSGSVDPLAKPLDLSKTEATSKVLAKSSHSPSAGLAMSTIVGGLAICLGIFLLMVVLTRRKANHQVGPLPPEVIESLGRMPFNQRQHLQLIRLGKKLILLIVSPQETNAVAEIDDPDEVTRLVGLCQQDRPNSVTATFREVLSKYGQEPMIDHDDDVRSSGMDMRGSLVRGRRATREVFHG